MRGSGDDGLATYSDSGASGNNPQMQNTRMMNNTSVATYWANGLRVAGGTNVVVQGNLVDSVSANNGIEVSVFGNTGNPLDSALVSGNTILRGGGWNGTDRHGMHVGSPGSAGIFSNAYTRATITNNIIRDSLRAGLAIGSVHETVTMMNNVIDHPAWQGIWIESGVTGAGVFKYNVVTNLNTGQAAFKNDSPATFTVTLVTNFWPLAQGQPATANSYQTGNVPANGNDGSPATCWTASSSNYPQWWQVDLGNSFSLTSVAINWYNSSSRGYGYQIAVSSNNVNFTTAVDKSGNTAFGNTTNTFSAVARYVRITVTSCTPSGGSAAFYECNIYSPSLPAAALNPTNITAGLSTNLLKLSWPADHLGWRLQVQTNALPVGLGTNWVELPGSDLLTATNITINTTNGAVYYRMVYP